MDSLRQVAASQCRAFAVGRLSFVDLAARDDDVGAALGERLDHAIAEPARSAGDERDLAGEIEQRIGGHAAPLSRMAARRVGICSLGNSPGAGLAVLRWALATCTLWTSVGPSANAIAGSPIHMSASGVSSVMPRLP